MEKGGEKKPVRKEITNSLIGDRVSMKNKDVAQREKEETIEGGKAPVPDRPIGTLWQAEGLGPEA